MHLTGDSEIKIVFHEEPDTFTPRLRFNAKSELSDELEPIRLYPYGVGKLRMTVFNEIE